MHFYPTADFAASIIYIIIGIYVFYANPTIRLNKIFLILCFSFAIWAFADAFTIGSDSQQQAFFWHSFGSFGWTFAPAFLLHFFIILSNRDDIFKKIRYYLILYLPPAFLLWRELHSSFMVVGYSRISYGWKEIINTKSFLPYLYNIYYLLFIAAAFVLVRKWGKSSQHPAIKKQSTFILITGIITIVLAIITNRLLPVLDINIMPPTASIMFLIWICGIWYAIAKYKLMVVSPLSAVSHIMKTMTDAVLLLDPHKKILFANKVIESIFQIPVNSLKDKHINELFPGERIFMDLDIYDLSKSCPIQNAQIFHTFDETSHIILNVSASCIYDDYEQPAGIVVILRDITEIKKAEEQLIFMATHDALTGLPARSLMNDRLRNAIARARRYDHIVAVLLIDLDDFKKFNDTLGHSIGDIVLQEIAHRLQNNLRESDTVARIGGDEFVIILTDIMKTDDVATITTRILDTINKPLQLSTEIIHPSASLGISLFPDDGAEIETLLKNADMAMYRAKQLTKNNYQFYSNVKMGGSPSAYGMISADLSKAIERSEFELYYQPIIDLHTGDIAASEALLRWHHPQKGMVAPMEFIPVAEKTGQIIRIGEWVLKTACFQNKEWQNSGLPPLPVAVNFSLRQFQHTTILDYIVQILKDTCLEPQYLHIEITESTAISDIDRSGELLKALHELGIMIIIDDFGAGYSSLRWLRHIPVYALKVDRFFVQNIMDNPNDIAIVSSIISMAHSLGLRVIAEGVETQQQLELLRDLEWKNLVHTKCDLAQGFLLGKPLPASQFKEILSSKKHSQG